METFKLVLIILISAIILGALIGFAIGKIQIKLAHSNRKLFSRKEKIILLSCVAVGICVVMIGIFWKSGDEIQPGQDGMGMEEQGEYGDYADGKVVTRSVGNAAVAVFR